MARIVCAVLDSMGIAHGGLLVAFADALSGMSVYRLTRLAPITVRLTSDFIASAKQGDWVEGQAAVVEVDANLVFVNADVYVADRTVLTAQGVFKAQRRNMAGTKKRAL